VAGVEGDGAFGFSENSYTLMAAIGEATMALTRQQRRKRLSELAKRGPQLMRSGLPARHSGDDVVALGLVLRGRLVDARVPDRASRTAALAAELFDRSIAAQPSPEPIACRMGCAHCCRNTYVSVTAPEAFLLAHHLRAAAAAATPDTRLLRAAMDRLDAMPSTSNWSIRDDCPLLENDLCQVYAVRPLACRHLASLSAAACLAVYEGGTDDVPVPSSQAVIGQGVKLAFMAALRAADMSDAIFEMRGAVKLAAGDASAEPRWLRGENVLAGALPDPYRPPDVERLLTAFAADIKALAEG
jgi:Putative zinc- or iron-chelating domain